MDVLIICQAVGFRRAINIEALERQLGVRPLTFQHLLRDLISISSDLRTLSQAEELSFRYVSSSGALVRVSTRESVRSHASVGTFFLQPIGSRRPPVSFAPTSQPQPQSDQSARLSTPRRRLWLVSALVAVAVIAIVVPLASGSHHSTTGTSVAPSAGTNSIASASIAPAQAVPVSYEAEASNNAIVPPAYVYACNTQGWVGCSGGRAVDITGDYCANSSAICGELRINDVIVPASAPYTVTIFTLSSAVRPFLLQANGGPVVALTAPSSWPNDGEVTVRIGLKAGGNVLRLYSDQQHWAPSVDKVTVASA
jgi:hypothetical protein